MSGFGLVRLYQEAKPGESIFGVVDRVALAISGSDDPGNILDIHRIRARNAIEVILEEARSLTDMGGDIALYQLEDALK